MVGVHPAQRVVAVFHHGQKLHRGAAPRHREHDEGSQRGRVPADLAADQRGDTKRHDRERRKDRHGVVPGEHRKGQKSTGQYGAGNRTLAAQAAQVEQKDQRQPDRARRDLRPVGGPHETRRREEHRADGAARAACLERAKESVREPSGEYVQQHEPPMDPLQPEVSRRIQRSGQQNPGERTEDRGLQLARQGLAAADVRVPEQRRHASVQRARLYLKPRQHLVTDIRRFNKGVLRRERDLPEHHHDADRNYHERGRITPAERERHRVRRVAWHHRRPQSHAKVKFITGVARPSSSVIVFVPPSDAVEGTGST